MDSEGHLIIGITTPDSMGVTQWSLPFSALFLDFHAATAA